MCTSIVEIVSAAGAGKTGNGWIELTHSVVSYDHPHHALLEEAITIDFRRARAWRPGRGGTHAGVCQGVERCADTRNRRSRDQGKRTFARDMNLLPLERSLQWT